MKRITQFILCLVLAVSGYGQGVGGNSVPRTVSGISNALDLISSTQGTVFYRGASGWEALTPGSSGQFLVTNGAGANPSWGTGTSGALPSQTGNSGKLVTTDGTNASWTTTPVATSLTGPTSTDLTLSGGSSGASLVLGSGASGYIGTSNQLRFGTLSPTDPTTAIAIVRAIGGTPNLDNVRDESVITATGAGGAFCSFDASATYLGIQNYNHLAAFQDRQTYSGSATLGSLWGFYSHPTVNTGGTLTNRYGALILDVGGSGTVTNNYGIYVDPLSRGSTNNYAIYTVSSPSFFGGQVQAHNIQNAGVPVISAKNTASSGGNNFTAIGLNPNSGSQSLIGSAFSTYAIAAYPAITAGNLFFSSPGDIGLIADGTGNINFQTGNGVSSLRARISNAGNLLIGTTTDISGSGGLKVAGTTASTGVGTGALQVAGGIYAGAASVFGGAVTTNGNLIISRTGALADAKATLNGVGANGGAILELNSATGGNIYSYASHQQAGVEKWMTGMHASFSASGYIIRDSVNSVTVATFNAGATPSVSFGGVTILKNYTVATLPAAASYTYGTAFVSDATNAAGTGGGTAPTGGGAVKRLVYSDGTNWLLQ